MKTDYAPDGLPLPALPLLALRAPVKEQVALPPSLLSESRPAPPALSTLLTDVAKRAQDGGGLLRVAGGRELGRLLHVDRDRPDGEVWRRRWEREGCRKSGADGHFLQANVIGLQHRVERRGSDTHASRKRQRERSKVAGDRLLISSELGTALLVVRLDEHLKDARVLEVGFEARARAEDRPDSSVLDAGVG